MGAAWRLGLLVWPLLILWHGVACAQDLRGLEQDFGGLGGLGGYEDGIGPGEDFGDYEDKYMTMGAEDGEGDGGEEEEEEGPRDEDVALHPALGEDSPASHMDGVVDLDDITFEKLHGELYGSSSSGGRKTKMLMEMYAPWDKACKEVVPLVKQLGKKFASDKHIFVAKADVDRFSRLASRFAISTYTKKRKHTYPHFVLFSPTNPAGEHFQGELTLAALSDFALDMAKAGIVEALVPLVEQFMTHASHARRQEVLSLVDAATPELSPEEQEFARYYHKVMATVLDKGDDHISKESERLSGIIKAGSMQQNKLHSFRQRLNILKVFRTAALHDEL